MYKFYSALLNFSSHIYVEDSHLSQPHDGYQTTTYTFKQNKRYRLEALTSQQEIWKLYNYVNTVKPVLDLLTDGMLKKWNRVFSEKLLNI